MAASAPTTLARGTGLLAKLAVAVWFLRYLRWRFLKSRPRGTPITGHWLGGLTLPVQRAAVNYKLHDFLFSLHKALGQTFAILPVFPVAEWFVVTTNPENVEHILKTNFDNYPKGKIFRWSMTQLLGKGIFNADGHDWYQQRKTTSHMFTAKIFKEHIWVVVKRNARKLRKILQEVESDKPVDIFNHMNRFTLDSIAEIGFSKCIGSLEDPTSPFLKSFDRAQQISMNRLLNPLWIVLRFFGKGTERETEEHFSLLDEYSRSVVRDLQSSIARDGTKASGIAWGDLDPSKSFVGLFLEDARKRGEHISEDYLRDLVLNFLIAGRDTTAQALSWTFFCLSQHPAVEDKARQEVLDVCGRETPKYEDLNKLVYCQAVLSEALRLYPSVPLDIKRAEQDDVWPDGTRISAGTNIVYNIFSMGRDEKTWGKDAEAYRPERWLEMKEVPDNYHFPVFNGGPRECLGKRLSIVEMKGCLATLLPHVSLKIAVPADQICTDTQLTIGMGRGLPCYVINHADEEDAKSNVSTTDHSECSEAFTEPSEHEEETLSAKV